MCWSSKSIFSVMLQLLNPPNQCRLSNHLKEQLTWLYIWRLLLAKRNKNKMGLKFWLLAVNMDSYWLLKHNHQYFFILPREPAVDTHSHSQCTDSCQELFLNSWQKYFPVFVYSVSFLCHWPLFPSLLVSQHFTADSGPLYSIPASYSSNQLSRFILSW